MVLQFRDVTAERINRDQVRKLTEHLEREKVNVPRLIRQTAGNLNHKGIHIHLLDCIYAYADKRLLKILFDNILSNAVKFSSKVAKPQIEVGCMVHDDYVDYFIKDNGIGIDMDKAEGMFRPFQRMVRDEDYPGFGIGLAIARRIISRHGGSIRVVSKPAMGATFYVRLPTVGPND